MSQLVELILSNDAAVRDTALDSVCEALSTAEILAEAEALEAFRQQTDNLYSRARACLFLQAIHRFHLPSRPEFPAGEGIPVAIAALFGERRYEEAVEALVAIQRKSGPGEALSSALAHGYQRLAYGTLGSQVRRSVRSSKGNQWMFRLSHPLDQPLSVVSSLRRPDENGNFPVLREQTPVRMDLTHSGWSDIFFLAMDFPAGAQVLNVSVNLGVNGRDPEPRPPVEAYLRVIDEPVLRLGSVDLVELAEVTSLEEVFDFSRDGLGLLKASLIASGIVPPGVEGSGVPLIRLLERVVGAGNGIELVSNVNGIPKGSRLAVSTNLLACLISVCMRATGQIRNLEGPLQESDRRQVAARAILGEWIAGSGGGWQDSGGVWPGIKLIRGQEAQPGDPEYGISKGALLPRHTVLSEDDVPLSSRRALQDSLVLVHGGMAQNVGPILEMVTERYLLRSAREWDARQETMAILTDILAHLKTGDIRKVGEATTRNFFGPIQTIIPWASNRYTEKLIEDVKAEFGTQFWGFWMLGGMSGGGMGFIFEPSAKAAGQKALLRIMENAQDALRDSLPFAMRPVVYDFEINEFGTVAKVLSGSDALLPRGYYASVVPGLVKNSRQLTRSRIAELSEFAAACKQRPELAGMVEDLFDRLLPSRAGDGRSDERLQQLLHENGFDAGRHEAIRTAMQTGRISLQQNRLPLLTDIRDLLPGEFETPQADDAARGRSALRDGKLAVVTLAGGIGSRWTQGAGVVKALHPFAKFEGRHRTMLELHVAKLRRSAREAGCEIPHLVTTSFATHDPIAGAVESGQLPVTLSPGRAIGLRMVPMLRDLQFAWAQTSRKGLDGRALRLRESAEAALAEWVRQQGEGTDYTDNEPGQCVNPVGTWFEITNLLRNGVLAALLESSPQLQTLLVHSIDTVGVRPDAAAFGAHLRAAKPMTIEIMRRRFGDQGGLAAWVEGRTRTLEDLALPRAELAAELTYGNSTTCWIEIDGLLSLFGLSRSDLIHPARVEQAILSMADAAPSYLTLKEVKRRYGQGHESVFPVVQIEKTWTDMSAVLPTSLLRVDRVRAQSLKEQAQLDGWVREGSAAQIAAQCDWN